MVVLAALVAAVVALTFTGARFIFVPSPPSTSHAALPPDPASYVGVFETGAPPDYGPVAEFAHSANKPPNMVAYYSGWAEPFAVSFARTVLSHGMIPCVQIDPTYASVAGVAAGTYDGYLRQYADSVRNFRHAVVIGFGHEMNAPWYSWGYGHVQPSVFVAAWRHIVTVFHDQGAYNVTWLWTINQDRPGTGQVRLWWPGARYVTWVGIDGYYFRPSDTFSSAFGHTIDEVQAFTHKPVLLSETAVGPAAGQFAKIGNLFDGMHRAKTLGLLWFDEDQRGSIDRQDQRGSIYHQDWRIEDSRGAQVAFRLGVAPLTLVRP